MKFTDAHNDFLNWLEVRKNKSPNTIEQYDRHLHKFREYLEDKNIDSYAFEVWDITLKLAERFRNYLYEDTSKNISIKTANAYMITLRSFLKFLEKTWEESLAPTKIDLIKAEDRMIEYLTAEEIERLFSQPDESNIIGTRDKAIMECIYSTGLRISELTSLNINDINLDTKEFAIKWKGRKVRVVYLTEKSAEYIQNYLNMRTDGFSPLFLRHNIKLDSIDSLSNDKVRLSRFFITAMIKSYALKANIIKNISAHTLRHSFATTLLDAWADLRSIQEMLWHASINTTQVYTHVTNQKLKETHKKYMK